MSKVTLTQVTSGYNATSIINSNNSLLSAAIDNTLSRDGSTPNTMSASLDMNTHEIINLAAPTTPNSAARWIDITSSLNLTGTAVPSLTGNAGKYLTNNGSVLSWGSLAGIYTLADGSVSSPSLNFANEIGTGLYRIGSNNSGYALSGTIAYSITLGKLTVYNAAQPAATLALQGPTTTWNTSADYLAGTYTIGTVANPTFFILTSLGHTTFGLPTSFGPTVSATTSLIANSSAYSITQSGGTGPYIQDSYRQIKLTALPRNNTVTLTADPEFSIQVPVGNYKFEIYLLPQQAAGGAVGFKYAVGFSGTATTPATASTRAINGTFTGDVGVLTNLISGSNSYATVSTTAYTDYVLLKGTLNVTVAGALTLNWAQNTASATNTILQAGSYIEIDKIV